MEKEQQVSNRSNLEGDVESATSLTRDLESTLSERRFSQKAFKYVVARALTIEEIETRKKEQERLETIQGELGEIPKNEEGITLLQLYRAAEGVGIEKKLVDKAIAQYDQQRKSEIAKAQKALEENHKISEAYKKVGDFWCDFVGGFVKTAIMPYILPNIPRQVAEEKTPFQCNLDDAGTMMGSVFGMAGWCVQFGGYVHALAIGCDWKIFIPLIATNVLSAGYELIRHRTIEKRCKSNLVQKLEE